MSQQRLQHLIVRDSHRYRADTVVEMANFSARSSSRRAAIPRRCSTLELDDVLACALGIDGAHGSLQKHENERR
jgi:hypothetical protein